MQIWMSHLLEFRLVFKFLALFVFELEWKLAVVVELHLEASDNIVD